MSRLSASMQIRAQVQERALRRFLASVEALDLCDARYRHFPIEEAPITLDGPWLEGCVETAQRVHEIRETWTAKFTAPHLAYFHEIRRLATDARMDARSRDILDVLALHIP